MSQAAADPKRPALNATEEELRYYEFAEISRRTVKRPLVLFFGREQFSESTKYLYLAAVRSAPGFEVVWCSFDATLTARLQAHNLPVFDMNADVRATCSLLMDAAAAVFFQSLASALHWSPMLNGCLAGAEKIQLWHGVSVKHLSLMLIPFLGLNDAKFRRQLRFVTNVDHVLSPASSLDPFWVRAFGCTSLIRAGYPRNEVIVRPPLPLELIGAELPPAQEEAILSSKRKILLVPTWQRGADPLLISTPAFQARLATWAAANNTIVFAKEHPFIKTAKPADISGVMYFLPSNGDVYPWMSKFDAMITDYSSIMFDFLLLNRPIFTFNSRTQVEWGFEPDYSLIPEGTFRYEFDATNFESVLEKNLADHPLQREQRAMRAALFETDPTQACEDLLRFTSDRTAAVVDKTFTVTAPQRPNIAAA